MDKWVISSSMSFFYKFIFTSLWIMGFGMGTLSITSNGINNESAIFIIAFTIGTLFIYWGCMRVKKVSIDNQYLYISNYSKTIKVHRSNIKKITENVFVNTNPIWIHFKQTNEFGDYIVFIPKKRIFSFFTSHPIVKELRREIPKVE